MIPVEKAEDYIIDDERLCTFIDDDECRATFVYGYHNATGRLQVWVQTTKECPVVVDLMGNSNFYFKWATNGLFFFIFVFLIQLVGSNKICQ